MMPHDHISMNDGHPTDIVCETDNGCVTRCMPCEVVHLEFGNIILKLDPQRFRAFKSFMHNLDYKQSETFNSFFNIRRRILIRIENTNLNIALRRDEYFELMDLLELTEIYLSGESWWSEK